MLVELNACAIGTTNLGEVLYDATTSCSLAESAVVEYESLGKDSRLGKALDDETATAVVGLVNKSIRRTHNMIIDSFQDVFVLLLAERLLGSKVASQKARMAARRGWQPEEQAAMVATRTVASGAADEEGEELDDESDTDDSTDSESSSSSEGGRMEDKEGKEDKEGRECKGGDDEGTGDGGTKGSGKGDDEMKGSAEGDLESTGPFSVVEAVAAAVLQSAVDTAAAIQKEKEKKQKKEKARRKREEEKKRAKEAAAAGQETGQSDHGGESKEAVGTKCKGGSSTTPVAPATVVQYEKNAPFVRKNPSHNGMIGDQFRAAVRSKDPLEIVRITPPPPIIRR